MNASGWFRYVACVGFAAAVVFLCFEVAHVNATTVALIMLLLVLGVATHWGLREGVFTSVVCVMGFNFFFLPPIGKWTISDPQNWVALTAFLVSAVVASQLSSKAKNRAEEAMARRAEIERLYKLSRLMLMDEEDLTRASLAPIQELFGLSYVTFYEMDSGALRSVDQGPVEQTDLELTAQRNEPWEKNGISFVPVRLGTRTVGSLGLVGPRLSLPEQESIANLVAIGYERMRALKRAAEAEASRQRERLKTFVLDGIAHDLKTPLTAIKTCVTTLITIPPQSEEKRGELLTIIDEETERLHRTISEAIQLARIESHKVVLERTRFRLVERIETLLAAFPDQSRFTVRVASEFEVTADAELLALALRQLFENARKYSGANTPIDIQAAQLGGKYVIRVADRGPGISPRELDRIFDKFYRGTRGRNSEGTGMGLAIARGIIEAHGGRIWAENRPGGGAEFTIELSAA